MMPVKRRDSESIPDLSYVVVRKDKNPNIKECDVQIQRAKRRSINSSILTQSYEGKSSVEPSKSADVQTANNTDTSPLPKLVQRLNLK